MEYSLESYTPLPEDIIQGNTRKIYSFVPLSEEEEATIRIFQEYAEKNAIEVPSWMYDDRRLALKLMHCTKGNAKQAIVEMKSYCEWQLTLPVPIDEVLTFLVLLT